MTEYYSILLFLVVYPRLPSPKRAQSLFITDHRLDQASVDGRQLALQVVVKGCRAVGYLGRSSRAQPQECLGGGNLQALHVFSCSSGHNRAGIRGIFNQTLTTCRALAFGT